jgi:preprotein translocase subunit SecE
MKNHKRQYPILNNTIAASSVKNPNNRKLVKQNPAGNLRKKASEKKGISELPALGYIQNARVFLREAKIEIKKVKWPTKKEMLAATGVVIFLTLIVALYFFLVDTCLIKIIKFILR